MDITLHSQVTETPFTSFKHSSWPHPTYTVIPGYYAGSF